MHYTKNLYAGNLCIRSVFAANYQCDGRVKLRFQGWKPSAF